MKLKDKVAIVTAGGRGIGRGIALCLAEEGADVVVNSFHQETAASVAQEIKAMGRRSLVVPGDVTQIPVINQVVQGALKTFGKIDILINNVGGGGRPKEVTGMLEQAAAEWDGIFALNLRAPVLMCRAVAPYFIKQKGGKIVNIASMAGRFPSRVSPASYGSVKAGLIKYTQYLADELGPHNINVNTVCPGLVYTDAWVTGAKRMVETRPEFKGMGPREWFIALNEGKFLNLVGFTPLMREQTPEDMGHAVVFLVSEDAKNITGQALNVDGGKFKN